MSEMSESTEQKIRQVIADLFNIPVGEVTDTSSAETIKNWDSVQHLNLVLALEESFGIQFEPDEIENLQSVDGIVEAIGKHQADAANQSENCM